MVFCCKKCWCSYREPTAYLCIPFAILQIAFVTYCMSTALVIPIIKNIFLQAIILITFYTILILILWSYIQCIFTEPGIVNKDILQKIEDKDPDVSTYHYCKKCNQLKPYHAHHCRRCGVCVLKLDHHCPWISNCVGVRNQKYFSLFLLYVILDETIALLLTGYYIHYYRPIFNRYFHAIPLDSVFPSLRRNPVLVALLSRFHLKFPFFEDRLLPQIIICIQGIFSMVFVIFCSILLYDQIKNIWYDTTFVEESNNIQGNGQKSFYDCFVEYMGDPFGLYWFLPLEGRNIQNTIDQLSCEMCIDEHDKTE